jgi:hypothetical protein
MRRNILFSALITATALLQGCDSGGGGIIGGKEDKVTQVKMDDIDSIEGTISDEMINTDESTDEAPLDNSVSADPKPKAKPAKDTKETAAKPKSDTAPSAPVASTAEDTAGGE